MKKYLCVKIFNSEINGFEYIHYVKKIKYKNNVELIELKLKDNSYRYVMTNENVSFTVHIEEYVKGDKI